MSVVLTGWDSKQFANDVIKAFVEANKIDDSWYMRTMSKQASVVYGNIAAVTAKNSADGSELADAGNTETGTSITADNPLKVWNYIPLSAINTHGDSNVVAQYAQHLGIALRNAYELELANFLTTSSPTSITFNDDVGRTGQDIADALRDVAKTFDANNVPTVGRYVLLHPTYFYDMYNVAGVRSGDYISGADNSKPFQEMNFLGMRVRSATLGFNTDNSANTNLDSKYRTNLAGATPTWGVAWHQSSLGVNWYEAPSISDDLIADKDAILVKARMQIGTGLTRGAGSRIKLVGDV
jgi:hypothetical protein